MLKKKQPNERLRGIKYRKSISLRTLQGQNQKKISANLNSYVEIQNISILVKE